MGDERGNVETRRECGSRKNEEEMREAERMEKVVARIETRGL